MWVVAEVFLAFQVPWGPHDGPVGARKCAEATQVTAAAEAEGGGSAGPEAVEGGGGAGLAGPEPIVDPDRICVCCQRTIMGGGATNQMLPCGHTFHRVCIDKWLGVTPKMIFIICCDLLCVF